MLFRFFIGSLAGPEMLPREYMQTLLDQQLGKGNTEVLPLMNDFDYLKLLLEGHLFLDSHPNGG